MIKIVINCFYNVCFNLSNAAAFKICSSFQSEARVHLAGSFSVSNVYMIAFGSRTTSISAIRLRFGIRNQLSKKKDLSLPALLKRHLF